MVALRATILFLLVYVFRVGGGMQGVAWFCVHSRLGRAPVHVRVVCSKTGKDVPGEEDPKGARTQIIGV